MKRLLALLLVLIMLVSAFSLVSCSKPENDDDDDKKTEDVNKDDEKDDNDNDEDEGVKTDAELIVGKWAADFDFGKLMGDILSTEMSDMASYFAFENLKIKWMAEFTDKGKVTMYIDEASAEAMFTLLQDQFYAGMKKFTVDLYNSTAGTQATFEEILAAADMTEETFKQQTLASLDKDELLGSFDEKSIGKYEIKDGKLFIDDEEYSYELSAEKFELKEYLGDNSDEEDIMVTMLPLVFSKVA